MLIKVVFAICLFGAVFSQPINTAGEVKILRDEREFLVDKGYKFLYETSDGQKRSEDGIVRIDSSQNVDFVVFGEYSYIGDDGQTYQVHYRADKDGFHPSGDHLPNAAGVNEYPEEIPIAIPPKALNSLLG